MPRTVPATVVIPKLLLLIFVKREARVWGGFKARVISTLYLRCLLGILVDSLSGQFRDALLELPREVGVVVLCSESAGHGWLKSENEDSHW